VAFYEQGYRAHVHLQPVPGHDGAECLFVGRANVGWGSRAAISAKYRSKPAGEILQRSRRRIARVPEGVRHVAGLEDKVSRPRDADLAPDLYANLDFEHIGVLVLVLVCA